MTWLKSEIQDARKVVLEDVLRERGYDLTELPRGNLRVEPYDDLIIKDNYWVWHSKNLKGNAIDFFMFVAQKDFNAAMEILSEYI